MFKTLRAYPSLYIVSGGALNSTHSLTVFVCKGYDQGNVVRISDCSARRIVGRIVRVG